MNVFVGAPASKYAGMAALVSLLVVGVVILISKDAVPMTQKFAIVLILFLMSLPGILLTLFQLTCLVTGAGLSNKRWWCNAYAWVMSFLMILYSALMVVVAVMSLSGDKSISTIHSVMTPEGFQAAEKVAKKLAADMAEADTFQEKKEDEAFEEEEKFEDPADGFQGTPAKKLEAFHAKKTLAHFQDGPGKKEMEVPIVDAFADDAIPEAFNPDTFTGCKGAPL